MEQIFSGLKVVEFASVLAGPAVGMFFAELGAEVVKIENKTTGGDVTRGWKLPTEDSASPISAYWCSVNYGKKHLMLDLRQPDELRQALDLACAADVVISNFKPSFAKHCGLDPESLHAQNPRLIYAQLNAFADPEDESPAFDVVLQAEAGFMYMNGEPDRPPVKMPVALIDILAAHQLKEGVLIALLQRERSGRGSVVESSLVESALASLANQATNWLMAGHIPQRMGARHPNIAPYGDVFVCLDGQPVLLAVGTERQFVQCCNCLYLSDLPNDPAYRTNTERVKNRNMLNAVIAERIAERSSGDLMDAFKKAGVPAARIRDMKAVFELPAAQAMVLEEGETKRMKTVAFRVKKVAGV